ncbi:MAG: hypothetical protein ACT4O0_14725 [Pseudonocardia sp.]
MVHDERVEARVTVRADLTADLVRMLGHHLDALLAAGARFIVLDLTRCACDHPLLDLLARIQRELVPRAGMITVVGLDAAALGA